MKDILRVDPGDASPIWRQIEEGVRRLVLSRSLMPGMSVPSVRDLAKELRVNPATVAKAYQRLVDAGVLMVKRGEGTFVADSPPRLDDKERQQILHDGAMRYASLAISAGAQLAEAESSLWKAWNELKAEARS